MKREFKTGTFYCGDCFDVMAGIEAGSVDMILNDPPYGTTRNKWDSVLPLDRLWAEYWRVAKPNGAVVMTAAQPFSSVLGASCIDALRYEWIWRKTNATGHLNAKRQPMREHESALLFCRDAPPYYPQDLKPHGKITRRGGNGGNFGVSGTENFQEWTNYPKSILTFGYDAAKMHPTQKPVALFEYLIRTYTNPGELVLDPTAGSGTTAIAAIQSGRRWICIERDQGYFDKACERVAKSEEALI